MGLSQSQNRRCRSRNRVRRGLTVYEVFLALTLLLGAMAVLSQHIAVGTRAGVGGRLQTHAALLAQTKMAEVVGGIEPMTAIAGAELADAGAGWSWTLEIAPGPTPDLLNLAVTVSHVDLAGEEDATFTLWRITRDPQMLLDAQLAAQEAATAGSPTSPSTGAGP